MTTTNTAATAKGRRPIALRFLIWSLYAVALLTLLIVAALIWLVLRDRAAGARVQEQIGELKAAGLPYDNASLAEYYARATDADDVDRWLAVLSTVQSQKFSQSARDIGPWKETGGPIPFAAEPWPDEAPTLEFMQTWSELRNEAKELALEDRKVRLPIEFDSLFTDLTLTQEVRQLVRLFVLEAQTAIRNRDSAAARDALLAIFGCARSVEGQPLLVSQLVRIATEGMAAQQLRRALEAGVLDAGDLQRVQTRIDKRPSLATTWETALNGERGGMLPMFTEHREQMGRIDEDYSEYAIPLRSRDTLAFLETAGRMIALPTGDLNEFHAGSHELSGKIEEEFGSRNWLEQFDTLLSSLAVPAVAGAGDAFVRNEMQMRLATLAIGVRLYEDKYGVLPDSLGQLSEIGLDASKLMPLGDKPFGYRREADKAVLWGFQLGQHQATPDEPPEYLELPAEESTSETSAAEQNREWVWEFPERK